MARRASRPAPGQNLHASRVALFEGHVAPARHLVEGAGHPGIDHVEQAELMKKSIANARM